MQGNNAHEINLTEAPARGGARAGAGRPSQGKTRINLTLNSDLVERARAKEGNLSRLLDRLLADWLRGL
ncbi:MAG: type II toxin-antitoxin system CcdA family antitoxin [Verrucomicrobiaceae bacterium]|nr:type II toxin-antitoxin system CcdA family antitoxin [Verrucomicrobiaceae bacterium]